MSNVLPMLSDIGSALFAVVLPLFLLSVPGAALLLLSPTTTLLGGAARSVLASIVWVTLLSLGVTAAGWPVWSGLVVSLLVSVLLVGWRWSRIIQFRLWWQVGLLILLVVVGYVGFSAAALYWHDGLPTGDSQKSIFWAEHIVTTHSLPRYTDSPALLNRDPVDFYTPGLHALTATVMAATTQPLLAVSLFSIVVGLGVALVTAALAEVIWPIPPRWWMPLLPAVITLANFRFLRYLREPGYHYQNVVGELLLFGSLLLLLSLLERWRWWDFCLLVCTIGTLFLSHQFSMFVDAFALLVPSLLLMVRLAATARRHASWLVVTVTSGLVLIGGFAWALDLHEKIPHLFTTTPHLLDLTPAWSTYPHLLGSFWVTAGLAGLGLYAYVVLYRQHRWWIGVAFLGAAVLLLALSQGPHWFLDIPPVRALFYSVVPLSVFAAYGVVQILAWSAQRLSRSLAYGLSVSATLVVVSSLTATVAQAYRLDTAVRTNSSLSAELVWLAQHIEEKSTNDAAVLVDDYNRRAASWLILSHQPMYARVAADIATTMAEAKQSELRNYLYRNQLDYEKIFALASQPDVAWLLQRHAISWIASVEGKSARGFAGNPHLTESARAGDVVLWRVATSPSTPPSGMSAWLLEATTLVNDIGDDEDTFEHLMASLRTSRLSPPSIAGDRSERTTTAPLIPLAFNVGDYVADLWAEVPAARLQLVVRLSRTVPGVRVRTASGYEVALTSAESRITLPREAVTLDERGFAVLTLLNPLEQTIPVDLIALGLAEDTY